MDHRVREPSARRGDTLVPEEGLEPSWPQGPRDFESRASTNSATPAIPRGHRRAGARKGSLTTCGETQAAFGRRCIPPEPLRFAPFFVAFRSKYTRYSSLTRLVSRAPHRPRRSPGFHHRLLTTEARIFPPPNNGAFPQPPPPVDKVATSQECPRFRCFGVWYHQRFSYRNATREASLSVDAV